MKQRRGYEEKPERVVARKVNEYGIVKGRDNQRCQMLLIVNTLDRHSPQFIYTLSMSSTFKIYQF